jgi:uncharacterized membrane protein YdbT with pleckstrin-like domain
MADPVAEETSDPRLVSGENIVFETIKHWAAVFVDSKWAILLLIATVFLTWIQPDSTSGIIGFFARMIDLLRLGLFFVAIGWIAYNVVAWRTAEYVVTNLRVFGHEGLLRRRSTDTLLGAIADIQAVNGVLGRTLGYGNIRIISAAGPSSADTFTAVRNPGMFKRKIMEEKSARLLSQTSAPARAASADAPVVAQPAPAAANAEEAVHVLSQLATLRDAGAITEAEYDAKKAELLARI